MGFTNADTMPCHNCKDRHYLCHSECAKYKKVVEYLHKIAENRRMEKTMNHSTSSNWSYEYKRKKKK